MGVGRRETSIRRVSASEVVKNHVTFLRKRGEGRISGMVRQCAGGQAAEKKRKAKGVEVGEQLLKIR